MRVRADALDVESHDISSSASMQVHQQQLQQLINSQQQLQHAMVDAAVTAKVVSAADSNHPVVVSFPSFNDMTCLRGGLAPHSSSCAAAAYRPIASSAHQPDTWPTSSSASHSPSQQSSSESPQHRRVGISLLSQQIASASRSVSAQAEAASGGSGRGKGQFWRYLQEQRAKNAAELVAAVGHAAHEHQKQQQLQQNTHQVPQQCREGQHQHLVDGRTVTVAVESASPSNHTFTNRAPRQQQQQGLPPPPPPKQSRQRQQQTNLPGGAGQPSAAPTEPLHSPQRQQQQLVCQHTTAGELPVSLNPEGCAQQVTRQQDLCDAAQGVGLSRSQNLAAADGSGGQKAPMHEAAGTAAAAAAAAQQKSGPAGDGLQAQGQQQDLQQPGVKPARQQQQQQQRTLRPSVGPSAALAGQRGPSPAGGPGGGQRALTARASSPGGSPFSSAVSAMLLDSTVADSEQPGGWVHHFMSGCSGALAQPGSSWGGASHAGDALAAAGAGAPLQRPGFGGVDVSQPGWGLLGPAVLQGLATRTSEGTGRPPLPWMFSSGYAAETPGVRGRGGGLAAGDVDEDGPLNELRLAAAQLGTPPVPPRGSRFDDMDCFSGSAHKPAAALVAAAVAGELQARKEQQKQQVLQRRQRSLPHQLLLQLGLPAAVRKGSVVSPRVRRQTSLHADTTSRHSSRGQPVSSLLLLLNGQLSGGTAAAASSASASAASAAIGAQLEVLLQGLSLLGERSAQEVGHELAVADSIHAVCLQHHNRLTSEAPPSTLYAARASRSTGVHTLPVVHSSRASTASGMSRASSADSLAARLTAVSLSHQRREQSDTPEGSSSAMQRVQGLISTWAAAASNLGTRAAAAVKQLAAAPGREAYGGLAAGGRPCTRTAAGTRAAAATAANGGHAGFSRWAGLQGAGAGGQPSAGRGGLRQYSPAGAADSRSTSSVQSSTSTTTAAAAQAAAPAAAAAKPSSAGTQANRRRGQVLGPGRRWR